VSVSIDNATKIAIQKVSSGGDNFLNVAEVRILGN
jgi:hypothetical protein